MKKFVFFSLIAIFVVSMVACQVQPPQKPKQAQRLPDVARRHAKFQTVKMLINQGDKCLQDKKYEEAAKFYDAALIHAPGNLGILYKKGLAFLGWNKLEMAIVSFEVGLNRIAMQKRMLRKRFNELRHMESAINKGYLQAAEKHGGEEGKMLAEAKNKLREGKFEEALTKFNELISKHPDKHLYVFLRGCCYFRTAELDKAKADFNKVLEMKKDHEGATQMLKLIKMHKQMREKRKKEKEAKKTVEEEKKK